MTTGAFHPPDVYAPAGGDPPVRVLIAPGRYIQGPGTLDRLGRYLSLPGVRRAALLLSRGGHVRFGSRLRAALESEGVTSVPVTFSGQSSYAEVERLSEEIRATGSGVDGLIAAGGGKCLDAGKCVARRLSVPMISVPTVASTDAPSSAVSVLYTEDGRFADVEHFADSPAVVVVDTEVIARAPARYLVAGMGDALSTRYEARTCAANPEARTLLGARMTVGALAIADACAATVLQHGVKGLAAVRARTVTEALERVVEANTLLSGVGFEGGGLAMAHALATGGLTAIRRVDDACLHGELVAIGLLAQLVLEGSPEEARELAGFMASVGLPVHLGQISLDPAGDQSELRRAAELASEAPIAGNEPFPVTPELLLGALVEAHELGLDVARSAGDAAFRTLRGE